MRAQWTGAHSLAPDAVGRERGKVEQNPSTFPPRTDRAAGTYIATVVLSGTGILHINAPICR